MSRVGLDQSHSRKKGIMAGLLTGITWAVILSMNGYIWVKLAYSQLLSYDNGLLSSNPNVFSGMDAAQYINRDLQYNIILIFLIGLPLWALTGFFLAFVGNGFLRKQSFTAKGIIAGMLLWLPYYFIPFLLSPVFEPFIFFSSLLTFLFAGFLWGSFYLGLVAYRHP